MISFLNRHSYLFTSGLVMLVAWAAGSRFGGPWPSVAVAGVGLGLALVQRRLRGAASPVASWDGVQAEIEKKRPLLLVLFSNTCSACLASRPLIDALERNLGDRMEVLRVNVADDIGAEVRERFEIRMVPTLILLDPDGVQVYRTEGRLPNRAAIEKALDGVGGRR